MKQSIGQRLKELVGEVEMTDITNHMMVDVIEQRILKLKEQLNSAKCESSKYYEMLQSMHDYNAMTNRHLNYRKQTHFKDAKGNKFMVDMHFKEGNCELTLHEVIGKNIFTLISITPEQFYEK